MTLPQALAAVVDLQHSHRELLRVVDSLKPDDWQRGVPYGEWTVKDLVAHCIGDMSPSGAGLIAAGVLTPEFIADTSRAFDVRSRNRELVEERRRFTPEDLRQLLFEAHDARIEATLRLSESHLPVLDYAVPMGPEYEIRVLDWLWYGYHDREHADDIRRALAIDWTPTTLTFLPELDEAIRLLVRYREGLLRSVYSVADSAWSEPAFGEPGWSNKDILAHVASNDLRAHVRLQAVLGERDEAQLDAINQIDRWNQGQVDARSNSTIRDLVDELVAHRHQTLSLIARLEPSHLAVRMRLWDGREATIDQYITMVGEHEARHAGQLVPASRARRT